MSTRALSRRLAVLLLPIAVIHAVTVFNHGWASVAEPPTETPAQRLTSVLALKTDLIFSEAPLTDVVKFLKEKHGIEICIDEKALSDANVPLDVPITFQIKDISLRSALRLLFRTLDLKALPKEDLLWITTKDVHDDFCEPRVYEVLDLVIQPGAAPAEISRNDFDRLIDIIQNCIRPDAWMATGGPGAIERLTSAAAVIISVNPEMHDEIAELLSMLRRSRDQQFADGKLKPLANRSLTSIKTGVTDAPAIRNVLAKKTEFDYDQAPLKAVLKDLVDRCMIPLFIDSRSLNDANVALDTPVSFKAKACGLGAGLNMLLQSLDLRWIITDEVLLVTTKDVAEDSTVVRVYPVSDFEEKEFEARRSPGDAGVDLLPTLLQNSASPDSWSSTGGPGAIEYLPIVRSLVVVQTEKVHEEIERILSSLRLARIRQIPAEPEPPAVDVNDETLYLKVYSVQPLARPAGGMGMGGMGGGGMFSVLDETQKQPESTTPAQQDPPPVAPAQPQPAPQTTVPQTTVPQPVGPPPFDPTDDLAKIIPQVIEPASWKDLGGKGVIHTLPGRLIVLQTNRVHAQIAKFLRELR